MIFSLEGTLCRWSGYGDKQKYAECYKIRQIVLS